MSSECNQASGCGCGHDHGHEEGLSLPLIGAGIAILLLGILLPIPHWAKMAIHAAGWLLCGRDLLRAVWANLKARQFFDENLLMTVATLGAFALGDSAEGLSVLLFFMVGEYFQGRAVGKSRSAISALVDLRPQQVHLLTDDNRTLDAPALSVTIGSRILIKPGEKIPLDGVVLTGQSTVTTAALTGESMPQPVESGSTVLAGTVNGGGLLTVEVDKLFDDTAAAQILKLVEQSESNKAPTEQFITKFARVYTPVVMAAALLLAVVPSLVTGDWSTWVYRALVFLIISCPCALVLSIPLSFFAGIGRAGKQGILVKGGQYIEALAHLHTVMFDKTGTLTRGEFALTGVQPANGLSADQLLQIVASAEANSTHPLAQAVCRAYTGKPLPLQALEERPGHGLLATIDDRRYALGNAALMREVSAHLPDGHDDTTAIYVACDGQYIGCLSFADQLRDDAQAAVDHLRAQGIETIAMVTGDRQAAAQPVFEQLKLDSLTAEVLPAGKLDALSALQNKLPAKRTLAFVGDGINDAPVLKAADVGVGMGLGSQAAIEASDVVLMHGNPSALPTAVAIAKRTRRIVVQNIVLALSLKLVVLVLGALGMAEMWQAVLSDVGVALLCVLNAMRILRGNV